MKTETLKVAELDYGPEFKGTYEFQEISWAKRSRILQKHTKYHPRSGRVISSDNVAIQADVIMASLSKQPESKPVTLERLLSDDVKKGLPIELGEALSKAANKVCSASKEEEVFLEEQSNPTSPPQS